MTDGGESADQNPETKRGQNPPSIKVDEHSDNRKLWDWESKYPPEANKEIRFEAIFLIVSLVVSLLVAGLFLGLGGNVLKIPVPIIKDPPITQISCKLVAIFLAGCVGGLTFSIKWLVHSVATGKWHLDRRYWRLLVPWTGGVYALVVLVLFGAGLLPLGGNKSTGYSSASPALAFLVGYFSDGVSGLLSSVANAMFGTLEKK